MRNGSGSGMKIGLKLAEKLGQKAFGGETPGRGRKSARGQEAEAGSGFFDDVAGVLGGMAEIVMDMRQQVTSDIKSRMQYAADRADLATRQDIERLEAMVTALSRRVDALMRGEGPVQAEKPAAKTAPVRQEKPLGKTGGVAKAAAKAKPAMKTAAKPGQGAKANVRKAAAAQDKASAAKQTMAKTPAAGKPVMKIAKTTVQKGKNVAKAGSQAPAKTAGAAKPKTIKTAPARTVKAAVQPGATTRAQAKRERADLVGAWGVRLDALAAKGVSRAKFCADAGVAPAQLSRYMTGTNTPGWGAIDKVEAALAKAGV